MGGAEAHPDRAGLKPIKPILIQAVCTQITVSVCEGGGMQEHASGACPKLVNMEYVKFNMFSFNVNSTVKLNVKCHGHLTVKSRTLRQEGKRIGAWRLWSALLVHAGFA